MNLFSEFNRIINDDGIQVATIHAKNDNRYTILTQNGEYSDIYADGNYTGKVLIQRGRIIGQAVDLPYAEVEV